MIQAVPQHERATSCGDAAPFRDVVTLITDDEELVVKVGAARGARSTGFAALAARFGDAADDIVTTAASLTAADGPRLVRTPDDACLLITPCGEDAAVAGRFTIEDVSGDPAGLVRRFNDLAAAASRHRFELQQATSTINVQRDQLNAYAVQVSEDLEELTWLRSLANNLELSESGNTPERIVETVLPSLRYLLRAVTLVFIRDTPLRSVDEQLPIVWQTEPTTFDPRTALTIAAAATHVTTERPLVRNNCGEVLNGTPIPGVESFIIVPVATTSIRIGWLIALNKDIGHTPEWVEGFGHLSGTHMSEHEFGTFEASLMGATAVVLAAHGRNCSLLREKEFLLKGVIRSLVNAIDAKDSYTCGHSDRVAEFSRMIARQMGHDQEFCEEIYMTGLLHDIGKIGVPDHVLKKPGKLTDAEFELVKQHPAIGYEILKHLENLDYVLPGVLHHHEQVDGSGYPHGLAGDDIPLVARILAVADSYDAMTSSRPYRPGMPTEKAEAILRAGDGRQWDSVCLDAFLSVLPQIRALADLQADDPAVAPPYSTELTCVNQAD